MPPLHFNSTSQACLKELSNLLVQVTTPPENTSWSSKLQVSIVKLINGVTQSKYLQLYQHNHSSLDKSLLQFPCTKMHCDGAESDKSVGWGRGCFYLFQSRSWKALWHDCSASRVFTCRCSQTEPSMASRMRTATTVSNWNRSSHASNVQYIQIYCTSLITGTEGWLSHFLFHWIGLLLMDNFFLNKGLTTPDLTTKKAIKNAYGYCHCDTIYKVTCCRKICTNDFLR